MSSPFIEWKGLHLNAEWRQARHAVATYMRLARERSVLLADREMDLLEDGPSAKKEWDISNVSAQMAKTIEIIEKSIELKV